MTSFGWALLLLALVSGGVAAATGWVELLVVGVSAAALLLLSLLLVVLPTPATASLAVQPDRVTVGESTAVRVGLRPRLLPMFGPLVELRLDGRPRLVRLPVVLPWSRRPRAGHLDLPARRRGVYEVGPLVLLRSDPAGCFRRRRTWPLSAELHVHPEVTLLDQHDAGLVSDLDATASDQPAPSDLAFHTLREYVRGDDLRHVHWRSSAKADHLLVRQFVETRRSQATVVVDDDPGAYPSEDDFELAVSVGASLALRAVLDHCEVTLACGGRRLQSDSGAQLLDETCRFEMGGHELVDVVLGAAAEGAGSSVAVLVTGARRADADLMIAAATLPGQSTRVLVRIDRDATPSALTEAHGTRLVTLARLEQLGGLLSGALR